VISIGNGGVGLDESRQKKGRGLPRPFSLTTG
jgi:hypothetical protein